jgi:long-chain acyl-CoA synthetase
MKRTVAALLEEVATIRPDHVALSEPGRVLTYAELWAESGRVAATLSQNGAREGAVVVLSNANGSGWLETLFGALRADCVVAVVDPKLPPEQSGEVCASLEPAAIFTMDRLSFSGGPSKPRSPDPRVAALHAAGGRVLYFTSGSTGLPKGVLLAEDTLLANVDWNTELLTLKQEDVGCLHLPLSHSYNLVFALCFLRRGATLLVERDLSDLHGTVARMATASTTVLQSVPTSLRTLVERGDFESTPLERLRLVRVGAGVLTDDLAGKAFRAFPRASIVATYGMTELGLVASRTWTRSPIVESTFDRFVPGLMLDVLDTDEEGKREGEIEVSHPLLFIGYFDVSARSLALREGSYRTGDLGRWSSPGVLELRSRKKAVAKVAGVLVNLEEIARIAASQEGVRDSYALAIPHAVFGESVHVFLAVAADRRPDAGEVASRIMERTLLRTSPRVHLLDELPRGESGKIARTVLEAIACQDGSPQGS